MINNNLKVGKQIVYFKSSEHMTELEDSSIDVIVTSPPYNRGKRYSSDKDEHYDDLKTPEQYHILLLTVFSECLRVLKPSGLFFLNIGDSARDQGKSEDVVRIAQASGFIRIQTIIWIKTLLGKGHYTPSGGSRRLNNIWENVFMLAKDPKLYALNPRAIGIPYADKSNIGRYSNDDLRDAGNVWLINYSKTTGKTVKKGHDAPFPIELAYKCIKLVPNASKILDPFAGTGSTLAACETLGVQGIGYDLYPRQDIIRERILSGNRVKIQDPILIPHMKIAIECLIRNFLTNEQVEKTNFSSKKQLERLEILNEVIKQLEIESSFSKALSERINSEKNGNKEKITKIKGFFYQ